MTNLTPRLALQQPVGPDLVSALRLAIVNNAATLDAAAVWQQGTFAARVAASSVDYGTFYRSTDTGDVSFSTGSSWVSVALVGSGSAAALYQSGTSAGRPAASADTPGTIYQATDTNQVSLDLGSTWMPFRLVTTPASVSVVAAPGQLILANAAPMTVTLPTPTANAVVGVFVSNTSVTGNAPVRVQANGGSIAAVGAFGAPYLPLGTTGSFLVLQSDGNIWFVVAGQQDTGWIPVSYAGGVIGGAAPLFYEPASSRLLGDRVYLRGSMVNVSGGTLGTAATLSNSTMFPAKGSATAAVIAAPTVPTAAALEIDTAGALMPVGFSNGATLWVDGVSYPIN